MPAAARPNILWIMTDQQRYDALGANANPLVKTPHLDAFAARAANFSHAFVQAPVCVPSRQTFFTSRYPHSHRNRVNYTPLKPDETLVQARLREAGYATGCAGKLHYYPPTRERALGTGFDELRLHDAAHTDAYSDYVKWLAERGHPEPRRYRAREPLPGGNPHRAKIADELHETTWCGQETRAMLRRLAAAERPFFLFSSYWKPHAPFEVPEPWASMYDEVEFPLPDFVDLAYVQSLPLPVQKMILRGGARPFETSAEDVQWKYRSYFAACSQIDREVGATLDVLDELGLRDSTLVIFCSDHGDQMLEHGLYGKNVFFEGSVRVPLMLAHPSIRPGPCDDLVESTDVLPTVIELCGLERPSCFQGRSLLGRIGSAPASAYEPRRYVFAENVLPEVMTTPKLDNAYAPGRGVDGIRHPDAKMVRSKRWKYCYYVGHGEELYDLEKDPGEMRNRANDPACAGVKRELKDALLDWLITADEPDQIAPRWREV